EAHAELHAAAIRADRGEQPLALQRPERAAHEVHQDPLVGLALVAGGELAVQRPFLDADGGHNLALGPGLHARVGAPRQEARVALDIVDEREQAARRLGDERRALDLSHGGDCPNITAPATSFPIQCRPPGARPPPPSVPSMPSKAEPAHRLIAENRKARFDYFIEERYEAGLALQGWEVKAMRAGRAQLKEAYVYVRAGEAFLIGAHLSPLPSTSSHVVADPVRTRKLLLHQREINGLIGAVERKGYTVVPLEAPDRARQGQEATRQARRGEGARLAAGQGAAPQRSMTALRAYPTAAPAAVATPHPPVTRARRAEGPSTPRHRLHRAPAAAWRSGSPD